MSVQDGATFHSIHCTLESPESFQNHAGSTWSQLNQNHWEWDPDRRCVLKLPPVNLRSQIKNPWPRYLQLTCIFFHSARITKLPPHARQCTKQHKWKYGSTNKILCYPRRYQSKSKGLCKLIIQIIKLSVIRKIIKKDTCIYCLLYFRLCWVLNMDPPP